MEERLIEPHDWKRVSISLIKKKGGQGLLRKYADSISSILQTLCPNEDWKIVLDSSRSHPQKVLKHFLINT